MLPNSTKSSPLPDFILRSPKKENLNDAAFRLRG